MYFAFCDFKSIFQLHAHMNYLYKYNVTYTKIIQWVIRMCAVWLGSKYSVKKTWKRWSSGLHKNVVRLTKIYISLWGFLLKCHVINDRFECNQVIKENFCWSTVLNLVTNDSTLLMTMTSPCYCAVRWVTYDKWLSTYLTHYQVQQKMA